MEETNLKEKCLQLLEQLHLLNSQVNINRIPLRKQVNVIWLSKVITDVVLLERKSGISQTYISYILTHEKEILNRWLNACKCIKNKETLKNLKEKYECDVLDQILFEWAKRKMLNFKRTVHPCEIELQANVIKRELDVPKYSIGIDFWNRDYTYKSSLSEQFHQNLSLDTADILNDICHEIHLPTYIKFMKVLTKLDRMPSIGARMHDLNEVIDTKATREYIGVSCGANITSDNEFRRRDEAKVGNVGQPETKKEERRDPLYQQWTNVVTKTEEPEKDFKESLYTRNKNNDVIPLKENEGYKCSFIEDETSPIEESIEDEVIRQEVLEILAELREEIQDQESPSSQLTEDSSVGSIEDFPLISTTLHTDDTNLQKDSANSTQNVKSLMLLPTDSIQELVEKYEIYKSQQQSLQASKILCGYQEIPAKDFMEIYEMRNKVLNIDEGAGMDKIRFFSSRRENIEYTNTDLSEVAIEQKDNIEDNIGEHQTNVQTTFTKIEADPRNQWDDITTKLEQRIVENVTTLESVISEDTRNLEKNEKHCNINHIERYNSDITYKKAYDDSNYVRPSKKNQTKKGTEILLLNNIQIAIQLEKINDSTGGYIQLIETTSDEEDVSKTINKDTLFNCNKNVNDMTQLYKISKDLRERRNQRIGAKVPKTNSEIVKPTSHKRKKPAAHKNYIRKRICLESGLKNKSPVSTAALDQNEKHYFHNDNRLHSKNIIHIRDDNDIIQNVDECNYGENGSNEYVTLLEVVSNEEDDMTLLTPPEITTHMNVSESETTTSDRIVSYPVNDTLSKNRQDECTTDGGFHVPPTVMARNCFEWTADSLQNTSASGFRNIDQFSIIELPAQESSQESINKHTSTINKSKAEMPKTDRDVSSQTCKLGDFFGRKNDYEAFKLTVNLQKAFLKLKKYMNE